MLLQVTDRPGFGMPPTAASSSSGDLDGIFRTSNESSAASGAQINAADATTGWTSVNGSGALAATSTPASGAQYEGTNAIRFGLQTDLGGTTGSAGANPGSWAYLDLGSDQDYSANPYITFAWQWVEGNTHDDHGIYFEIYSAAEGAHIADGGSLEYLGTPHTRIRIPLTKDSAWTVLPRMKIVSPTLVRYLVWRSNGEGSSATGSTTCYVDDIRTAAVSEADTAMNGATDATVLIHAAESLSNEAFTSIPDSAAVIDLRDKVTIISNFNGAKYVRSFMIDGTGVTECHHELNMLLNSLQENDTLIFPHKAHYRYNNYRTNEILFKRNVTIYGNGSRIFTTLFPAFYGSVIGTTEIYRRGHSLFAPRYCKNLKVFDLEVWGYQKWVYNGWEWNDISGTTAVVLTPSFRTHDTGASSSDFVNSTGTFAADGVRGGMIMVNVSKDGITQINMGAGIVDGSTTADITVDSTSDFASSGTILIENEMIAYTSKTATTFSGISRAQNGTTGAAHADNTFVYEAGQNGNVGYVKGSGTDNVTATTITIDEFGMGTDTDDDWDVGEVCVIRKGRILDANGDSCYQKVSTGSHGSYSRKARTLKVQDPDYCTEDLMFRWDVEYIGTAAVSNDLRFDVVDENSVTVYSTTVSTTTSWQTAHIAMPTDDFNINLRMRLQATKITAGANTITIGRTVDYGWAVYNGLTEFMRGFQTGGATGTTAAALGITQSDVDYYRCHAEGVGGDPFETDGDVTRVEHHDCTSMCAGRQGASLSGGRDIVWEGGYIASAARSGIDHEPAASERIVRCSVRHTKIFNCGTGNLVSAATNPSSKSLVAVTATTPTALNGDHNSSITTITVDSTTGFAGSGYILVMGDTSEIIAYAGTTATTFTGCTRAQLGTTAQSLSDNSTVEEVDTTARAASSTADIRLAGGSGDPTDRFPSSGTVLIDEEEFTYTGTSATALTGITSDANGTWPTAHAIGSTVLSLDPPTEAITYDDVTFWVDKSTNAGILAYGKNWTLQNLRFVDNPDATVSGALSSAINMGDPSRGTVIKNIRANARVTVSGYNPVIDGVWIKTKRTADFTTDGVITDPLLFQVDAQDPQVSNVFVNGQPYD